MERVLVTGCLGFVGRALTALLEKTGREVWGVDRATSDPSVGERYRGIDLTDRGGVSALFDAAQPRYVVHLAAQSSAGRSFDAPHETLHNNVVSVLHLLEEMRRGGRNVRMLAVGSADVYGTVPAEAMPLSETRSPAPQNPYALSKAIQEQCCERYTALYDVDVVSTRSFNHTGAGQRDTFVLPSFARQLVEIERGKRDPVVAVGNMAVRRDFSDVRDVCRAYVALMQDGKKGEVYNVCSGRSYALRDLLDRMIQRAGVEVEVRRDPKLVRPVDMEELRGDPAKVMRDTRWRPEVDIDDTLSSLLDFWRAEP